ncbi:MAG: hypothetical protein QM762_13680 [Chryseolinea sp.]
MTITKDLIKKLVLVWTAILLFYDIFTAVQADTNEEFYWIIFAFIAIDAVVYWTSYQMVKGKYWALVTLIFYFGLRTISIYTEDFSFYIKSGLNIEILIAKTIGINATALIVFVLLIRELHKTVVTNDRESMTKEN